MRFRHRHALYTSLPPVLWWGKNRPGDGGTRRQGDRRLGGDARHAGRMTSFSGRTCAARTAPNHLSCRRRVERSARRPTRAPRVGDPQFAVVNEIYALLRRTPPALRAAQVRPLNGGRDRLLRLLVPLSPCLSCVSGAPSSRPGPAHSPLHCWHIIILRPALNVMPIVHRLDDLQDLVHQRLIHRLSRPLGPELDVFRVR